MMKLLADLPKNVVGAVASGHVSASDYESVLVPAIESALKEHGRVRMLYQLGPEFTGFSVGALWDDLKLGFGHMHAWERIAVVTDVDWIAGATRLFTFAMPCPVKVYSNSQMAEARHWIIAA